MEYNEARLLVSQVVDEMERKQIEIGNNQFKHAYIVGALTSVIATAISTETTKGITEFLHRQLNKNQ
jgi:hypothetical protein